MGSPSADRAFERALEWEPTSPAPYHLILEQSAALVSVMLKRGPVPWSETERLLRYLHRDLSHHRTATHAGRVVADFTRTTELVHGTRSGYQKHRRRGEEPCEPCLVAKQAEQNARRREVRASEGKTPRARVAACGTSSGYQAHKRRQERPCLECVDAQQLYDRERKRSARRAS